MSGIFQPGRRNQSRRRARGVFDGPGSPGFTLIELLVILGIIGLFSAILLPALDRAKQKAKSVSCLDNLKHLTLAWSMYSADNNDRLVPNGELGSAGVLSPGDPALQPGGIKAQWCPGSMQGDGAAALPLGNSYIEAGLLYPFVNNLAVYKCPADQSAWPVPRNETSQPRVRSLSMNCWLNPIARSWNAIENYTGGRAQMIFTKASDLGPALGAGQTWVFIDENPASIDDGYFVCDLAANAWVNVPATWHAGSGGVAFADGHAQIKKWTDPRILVFDNYAYTSPAITLGSGDYLGDLRWLQGASTVMLP